MKAYLSGAVSSMILVAVNRSARLSVKRTTSRLRVTLSSLSWKTGSNANQSTGRLRPSRTVLGPRNGRTKYGPLSTPQVASVWPKSSLYLGKSNPVATSIKPNRPMVLFQTIRAEVETASCSLNCNSELKNTTTSSRLLKKLVIPVLTASGIT